MHHASLGRSLVTRARREWFAHSRWAVPLSAVLLALVLWPAPLRATVLSGNVNSTVDVGDQITMNSVTNTAPIRTGVGIVDGIIINGNNVIGSDVLSTNNGRIIFSTGFRVTQNAGNLATTPNRHLVLNAGQYTLNGGSVTAGVWFALGTGSTFVQNGGLVDLNVNGSNQGGADIAGAEQIAGSLPGTATLLISNGTFRTPNMLVGNDATALNRRGVVVQEPGTTVSAYSATGRFPGTSGDALAISINGSTAGESSYTLKGGSLTVANANTRIYQWGEFGGYGTVTTTSARRLDNSGQVVANGFGVDRTLDLSQYGIITNSTENGTERTGAGWYAQNKGKVTLPSFVAAAGNSTVNWGESSNDTSIDLVNSLRLGFSNVGTGGPLSISLLASDRSDVPSNPYGTMIGVWDISDPGAFDFGSGSVSLTFRYDDAAGSAVSSDYASRLAVYHYTGGQWQQLASTINLANLTITATGINSFSMFSLAVVPEPNIALLLVGGGLLLWRRRLKR